MSMNLQTRAEVESVEVGPEAAAVLEFSTPHIAHTSSSRELNYVTSKGSFAWAAIAAMIAKHYSLRETDNRIDDIEIQSAIYRAVSANRGLLREYTCSLPVFRSDTFSSPIILSYEGYDSDISSLLINNFLNNIGIDFSKYSLSLANELNLALCEGYRELLDQHLISDPVIDATIGIAILSTIPFSFVRRTKDGHAVYLKLHALLWKYEWEKGRGEATLNLTLETARIAKALKEGLVTAYHHATKGEGDEPLPPADV
jgi:hypothetical protein